MLLSNYKKAFIDFLLQSGALKFGDFLLKSGRNCPYFLNLGQFFTGRLILRLGEFYAQALKENVKDFNMVFGPAYKGIPLSVITAAALYQQFKIEVGYSFNRKEVKDHGEGGILVGASLQKDSKIVIVDDVMTAGTALRESIELLKKHGNPTIQGVLIAVDRMERGYSAKSAIEEIQDEFGIPVYSIVTLAELIAYLDGREIDGVLYVDKQKMSQIKAYREQYGVS